MALVSRMRRSGPLGIGVWFVTALVWCVGVSANQEPASQLMRRVVNTEVKADDSDHSHWLYREHHVDANSDVLQECVQTKDGDICRHLAEWGQPLTGSAEEREQDRIHNLINNPAQEQKLRKAKTHDANEAMRLLRMLPDAFEYQYDGQDGDYVRLRFQPNPNFTPPSREARVFHAMSGTVLVDAKANRLVELRGKLIKDVDFGWGLLGHLNQGGTFLVKREDVGEGHWDTVLLDVDIHGKALFFHTINAQQKEVTSDYRKVSDDLTLAQGASMLFSPNLQAKAAASPSKK